MDELGEILREAREAKGWTKVQGRIINTTVRTYSPVGTTRQERVRLRTYFPEITYTWTVDGQVHTGDRYALGEGHPDYQEREEARKAAAAFPAGQNIDVFYNPKDPSSAVLDPAMKSGALVPLPIGLLFFFCGFLGLRYLPQIQKAAQTGAS